MPGIKAVIRGGAGIKAKLDNKVKIISASLQSVWDAETSANKNTFVDNNKSEIVTYIDSLTFDELVSINGRGYNFPLPSGQTTSYRVGDDAWVETNFFSPIRAENALKVKNTLIDFFTLSQNNVFANKNRFTDELGGQVYTNNYMIDHYTGLGIVRLETVDLSDDWFTAIDKGMAYSLLGFSDFFLPSQSQLASLINHDSSGGGFSYFLLTSGYNQLSSTTLNNNSLYAYRVNAFTGFVSSVVLKTSNNNRGFFVRKHF